MGVPVVSLVGNTHPQRMGASLLGAIGLDDLVARSREEYVRIAVALARDEHRRAELRSTLRSRFGASSLRDEREFVRGFETVVRDAWRLRLNARHTDARGSASHSAT
jgi:predicted O-linked N-acetylglucosamine transferase (SPINDLY family)